MDPLFKEEGNGPKRKFNLNRVPQRGGIFLWCKKRGRRPKEIL